ncbi:hypothetical protein DSO57_1023384 [Entomophthora muscae]|uniref:Uncharacterized protein n=1 Tax=Entomophthora muscae TaxID=34485 RepID=A0ACC2TQ05_9FUNG|nr:hypothetical protein DSO57_1023384 [Entomophthora muscae]
MNYETPNTDHIIHPDMEEWQKSQDKAPNPPPPQKKKTCKKKACSTCRDSLSNTTD